MAPSWNVLADADTKAVGTVLQTELLQLIDLSLQAKQAHWNVVGPHFRALHLQLDEMVEAYRGWGDEVAERLAALGLAPDGQADAVAQGSGLKPLPGGPIKDSDAVVAFAERVRQVAGGTRESLMRIGNIDPVSQDLLIEIAQGLEKQAWMLEAQRR